MASVFCSGAALLALVLIFGLLLLPPTFRAPSRAVVPSPLTTTLSTLVEGAAPPIEVSPPHCLSAPDRKWESTLPLPVGPCVLMEGFRVEPVWAWLTTHCNGTLRDHREDVPADGRWSLLEMPTELPSTLLGTGFRFRIKGMCLYRLPVPPPPPPTLHTYTFARKHHNGWLQRTAPVLPKWAKPETSRVLCLFALFGFVCISQLLCLRNRAVLYRALKL